MLPNNETVNIKAAFDPELEDLQIKDNEKFNKGLK